jgi:hypothetical protein
MKKLSTRSDDSDPKIWGRNALIIFFYALWIGIGTKRVNYKEITRDVDRFFVHPGWPTQIGLWDPKISIWAPVLQQKCCPFLKDHKMIFSLKSNCTIICSTTNPTVYPIDVKNNHKIQSNKSRFFCKNFSGTKLVTIFISIKFPYI